MFLAAIWKQGFASVAVFVLLLTIGNLVIFTILCWKQGEVKLITKSVPQYLLFGVVMILILLGLFQA